MSWGPQRAEHVPAHARGRAHSSPAPDDGTSIPGVVSPRPPLVGTDRELGPPLAVAGVPRVDLAVGPGKLRTPYFAEMPVLSSSLSWYCSPLKLSFQGDLFAVRGPGLLAPGADPVLGTRGQSASTIEFWPTHGVGLVQLLRDDGRWAPPCGFRLVPTAAVPIEMLELSAGTLLPPPLGVRFRVATLGEQASPAWRDEVRRHLLAWLPLWRLRRTEWAWNAAILARLHRKVLTPALATLTPSPRLREMLGEEWFTASEDILRQRQSAAALAWQGAVSEVRGLGLVLDGPQRADTRPGDRVEQVPVLLAPHERDRFGTGARYEEALGVAFRLQIAQHGRSAQDRAEAVVVRHTGTSLSLQLCPSALITGQLQLDDAGDLSLGPDVSPRIHAERIEQWLADCGQLAHLAWLARAQRLAAAARLSLSPGLFDPPPSTSADHWIPDILPRWRQEQEGLAWWRRLQQQAHETPQAAAALLEGAISSDLRTVLIEAGHPLTSPQLDEATLAADPAHPAARRWMADLAERPSLGGPVTPQLFGQLALRWAQAYPRLAQERAQGPWQQLVYPWMQSGTMAGDVAVPLLRAEGRQLEEVLALVPDALLRADWVKALLLVPDRAWRESVIRLLGRTPQPMVPTRPRVPYEAPVPVPGSTLDIRA